MIDVTQMTLKDIYQAIVEGKLKLEDAVAALKQSARQARLRKQARLN
jgi:hypothetical protein